MQEGAFALIDCLGFKGIWKNKNPRLVLKKLTQIERAADEAKTRLSQGAKIFNFHLKPQILLLSDTVAISVPISKVKAEKELEENRRGFAVEMVCMISAKLVELFIKDEPALTLRGCITYGEHLIKRNFIVGPAVDEAAEHEKVAQGAFVWLRPRASGEYEKFTTWRSALAIQLNEKLNGIQPEMRVQAENFLLLMQHNMALPLTVKNYDMPIKEGQKLRCSIVNPLILFEEKERRKETIDAYLKSFNSDKIDVLLKKQNTMDFLEEANKECDKFYGKNFNFEMLEKMLGIKPEDKKSN